MIGIFNNPRIKELFKFATVGVINTIVDYAVFTLVSLISPNIYLAQTMGYAFGVLCSYTLNSRWTFKSNGKFLGRELIKFLVVNLFSYLCSVGALWVLVDNLSVNKYIAKIMLIGVTFIVNYTLNRLWVFKKESENRGKGADKKHSEE